MDISTHLYKAFEKDIKKAKKRRKDLAKFKHIAQALILCQTLDTKYQDHKLISTYQNRRECHIEPEWLLIYKLEQKQIIFERRGSRADLFKISNGK